MTDVIAAPEHEVSARRGHASGSEWWKSAVIYQVYPRSFADSNGDGIGDIPGILQHVDYLHTLGVDAVWLSPVYRTPNDDNGYDISDYQNIDPSFGTLDDLDRLTAALHERGMKLVMDLVVNHTSDEHAWFVESASSTLNPKRDWYWWRPPRAGHVGGEPGAEPTNWESFFSGSAWQWHEASGEYYLHLFSSKQPDLNWENPEVRAAVYRMMNWWLDRGVDGFRMDVINLISKVASLPDGEVAPGRIWGDGLPYVVSGPRIHEYLAELHREVFAGRDGEFVTVGEMPEVTIDQARLYTDSSRGEVDMVFQFEHVGLDHGPGGKFDAIPLDIAALKHSLLRWQDGLAEVGWNSLYWNNHDQPRAVSRFGNDREYRVESAKALGAVLHLQRGTPYVYQGEELGMTNVPFAGIDEVRDIESLRYFEEATTQRGISRDSVLEGIRRIGRDNARTPMQWKADDPEHPAPSWIAINPNASTINAESQVGVAGSVFEFYRSLIDLRHDDPVVADGDFRAIAPEHPTLFAYERTLDGASLVVLANLADDELDLTPLVDGALWHRADRVLGNYDATDDQVFRPWEVRVFRRG